MAKMGYFKVLLERALGAEMTHHLGYEKADPAAHGPVAVLLRATVSAEVDARLTRA